MSQRAYMWNRNNPVAYSDPSGNDPGFDVLPPVVSSGAPSNSGGLSFWNLAGMTIGDLIVLGAPEEAPVEGAIARMATSESIATAGEAGYVIWGMIFQGPRVYDPSVEQWLQPDSYPGTLGDPMSQRAYMWNRNNPVAYGDPSGNDPGFDVLPPVVSSGAPSNSGGLSFWNLAGMTIGDLIVLGAPEEAPVEGAIARMATSESIATTGEAAVYATPEELGTIESHLSRPGIDGDPANDMMIHGLRSSMANGARLTDAYHEFYNHELLESYLYDVFGYDDPDERAAHYLALGAYNANPFSLYAPEVIDAFERGSWNRGYYTYWGL